ncbi:MAG: ABC transporter substrate-binding protein [Deltaproteobacteria bacterium]|nr:ABC transporter substrate-binding protein [Deltaproteobacteria bacterium]
MKRFRVFLTMAAVLLLGIGLACTGAAVAGGVKIVDHAGREVVLPDEVKRVVTTMPYQVEIMMALGSLDKVVGVHTRVRRPQVGVLKYCGDKLEKMTDIGAWPDINAETIIKLHPDAVIFGGREENMERILAGAGIPVVAAFTNSPPEEIVRMIGETVGAKERTGRLLSAKKEKLGIIHKRLADLPAEKRVKVIVVGFNEPTNAVGGSFFTTFVVEDACCVNVAKETPKSGITKVSLEQIIRWDPEIIVVNAFSPSAMEKILGDVSWKPISAVRNGRVCLEPPDTHFLFRQTTSHIGSLWLAKLAYPKTFDDIDIQKEMDDFWTEFYGRPFPGRVD